mmetsp:Transcript_19916/g.43569  ORF Transcript_19916/g.43569 Transcript_19916/m.43569 type:complete len:223 (+) Transcript_19916:312-980(+)
MMCVASRSRNQRSWEMITVVPAKLSMASSSERSVSTSRSFVGSSSMRRLPPLLSVLASWRRLRSPPERLPTFFCWSAPAKLYHEQYCRAAIDRLPSTTSSLPSLSSSYTVLSLASCSSRDWSTYMGTTVSPIFSSPPSGACWSIIMRNRVVLPAPLGPTMPTTAPGGMTKLAPSMSRRSPKPLLRSFASTTTSPSRFTGVGITMLSSVDAFVYSACAATRSS